MASAVEKATKLIALAADEGGNLNERMSAALKAAALIKQHSLKLVAEAEHNVQPFVRPPYPGPVTAPPKADDPFSPFQDIFNDFLRQKRAKEASEAERVAKHRQQRSTVYGRNPTYFGFDPMDPFRHCNEERVHFRTDASDFVDACKYGHTPPGYVTASMPKTPPGRAYVQVTGHMMMHLERKASGEPKTVQLAFSKASEKHNNRVFNIPARFVIEPELTVDRCEDAENVQGYSTIRIDDAFFEHADEHFINALKDIVGAGIKEIRKVYV